MAEEQDKKIKELEASLARELDQQVNLSKPTDSRMGSGVDLNPTLNLGAKTENTNESKDTSNIEVSIPTTENSKAAKVEATYDTASESKESSEEEISLDDLDLLLKQEVPELEKELNSLKEAGSDIDGKNVNLADSDLSDVVVHEESTELPKKLSRLKRLRQLIKTRFERIMAFLYNIPILGYKYFIRFLKEDLKKIILKALSLLKKYILSWITALKELTLKQKFMVLGLAAISGMITFLLVSQLSIGSWSQGLYLENFTRYVKGVKYEEAPFVPLSEEGQYPEFVVLLDKVVVNIRPSENSSANPMVAIRLYFEVTSRESAVEMKDREKEMRDLAQRILETFTYDQIITAEGKKAFKESLRKEMSSILNTGLVKNVYIDDILLKP